MKHFDIFAFGIGVFIGMILVLIIDKSLGLAPHQIREDAIRAGVAEYYLDQKHQRQFRWKESK